MTAYVDSTTFSPAEAFYASTAAEQYVFTEFPERADYHPVLHYGAIPSETYPNASHKSAWHARRSDGDLDYFRETGDALTTDAVNILATSPDIAFWAYDQEYPNGNFGLYTEKYAKVEVAQPRINDAVVAHYRRGNHEETLLMFSGNMWPKDRTEETATPKDRLQTFMLAGIVSGDEMLEQILLTHRDIVSQLVRSGPITVIGQIDVTSDANGLLFGKPDKFIVRNTPNMQQSAMSEETLDEQLQYAMQTELAEQPAETGRIKRVWRALGSLATRIKDRRSTSGNSAAI